MLIESSQNKLYLLLTILNRTYVNGVVNGFALLKDHVWLRTFKIALKSIYCLRHFNYNFVQ